MPSWTVRMAETSDAAAIAGLIRLAFANQSRPTHPLMHEAEREAYRQGLRRLWLGVRLVLDDNRRFFAAHGFKETTLHRHEGFTEPTWVTMERELPSPPEGERALFELKRSPRAMRRGPRR